MGQPRERIELRGGRLALNLGAERWDELELHCILTDGTVETTGTWAQAPEGGVAAKAGPVRATLSVSAGPAESEEASDLALTATADEAAAISELTISGSTARRLSWLISNGYQSWDDSGYEHTAGRSWWTAAVADDAGAGLAGAARSAQASAVRFDLDRDSFAISWCEPAGLVERPLLWRAAAGASRSFDPVRLAAGADVLALLSAVAPGSARARKPVPQGWLSWYHFGPWVTAADVLRHAELLAGARWRELGYEIVQIDDGWQLAYGDWRTNEKFEVGLPGMAEELAARGQTMGVWTAPLLVAESSEVAASAPDAWFVRNAENGQRATDPRHVVFGPMQILDGSNPEVQEHLRTTFENLRSSGVRYFKIDFLYAGAYAGTRALREAVAAIREGVGEGAYLLGCGAPLLPMLDLVDGCRIGPDTATPVYDFELGAPKPIIFGEEIPAVARDVAFRHHLSSWFHLDADVALVGGNLNLEQGRQLVTLAALSGGPFFASDDLDALDGERRSLLTNPDVLALVGGEPAVPDWEPTHDRRPPTVWRRRAENVIAIFNWSDQPASRRAKAPGAARLKDLWSGREEPLQGGEVSADLPPHGVRLVRLIPG